MMAPSLPLGSQAGVSGAEEVPATPAEQHDVDERLLVDAAIQGDTDAFAALYDRYVDRIYRHCYYRTGHRIDAEDLTQETFLRAWRAISRYRRTGAPFIAWLLTISDRLATSRYRKLRRLLTADVEAVPLHQRCHEDPEGTALTWLACDEVRRAILQLRPERRQVIILRFIDGLSVAEVAAALGKSEANISVIQHRALTDLRRLLERSFDDRHALRGSRLIRRLSGTVARAARERQP